MANEKKPYTFQGDRVVLGANPQPTNNERTLSLSQCLDIKDQLKKRIIDMENSIDQVRQELKDMVEIIKSFPKEAQE